MRPLRVLCAVLPALLVQQTLGDFYYPNFNDTASLRFNGAAVTSSCDDGGPYKYDPIHGRNDDSDFGESEYVVHEGTGDVSEFTVVTATEDESATITQFEAAFDNRDTLKDSQDPVGCDVRLRLTPARPYKVGSVMRTDRVPVLDGFETGFEFQITDHSRACTLVKDPSFGPISHRSCSVHGGDGLSFVIHGDPAGSGAVGDGGGGMGYAGLQNAIVLELDTWYNPNPPAVAASTAAAGGVANGGAGQARGLVSAGTASSVETDDALEDHIAIQASPAVDGGRVGYTAATRLGHIVRVPLADGLKHTVRVVYWPNIRYDLLHAFSASANLVQFLQDGGDARSIGTLAVYLDDGLGWGGSFNATEAVIAIPVNLGSVLRLPETRAWMGFTSSTGRAWEKHDVTKWYFCETPGCAALRGNVDQLVRYFDTDRYDIAPNPADEVAQASALAPVEAGEVDRYGPAAVQ